MHNTFSVFALILIHALSPVSFPLFTFLKAHVSGNDLCIRSAGTMLIAIIFFYVKYSSYYMRFVFFYATNVLMHTSTKPAMTLVTDRLM